jgi:hypothetical protein
MKHSDPLYINEHQSDLRGIKDGWYAVEKDGTLVSGPFSSREDCLKLYCDQSPDQNASSRRPCNHSRSSGSMSAGEALLHRRL